MKAPSLERFFHLQRPMGIFVAGIVVGAAVFSAIYHHNFNLLTVQNSMLKNENNNLRGNIQSLTKYKNKETIIQGIIVHVEQGADDPALDEISTEEIKQRVQKDLKIFIGQQVEQMPKQIQVAVELLHQKIYPSIREKNYVLEFKLAVIVRADLNVWVTAKEFKIS